jgi:hypothetical protein
MAPPSGATAREGLAHLPDRGRDHLWRSEPAPRWRGPGRYGRYLANRTATGEAAGPDERDCARRVDPGADLAPGEAAGRPGRDELGRPEGLPWAAAGSEDAELVASGPERVSAWEPSPSGKDFRPRDHGSAARGDGDIDVGGSVCAQGLRGGECTTRVSDGHAQRHPQPSGTNLPGHYDSALLPRRDLGAGVRDSQGDPADEVDRAVRDAEHVHRRRAALERAEELNQAAGTSVAQAGSDLARRARAERDL